MLTREQRESETAELVAQQSLAGLVGSDKQCAWAEKIRATKLDYVANAIVVVSHAGRHPEEVEFLTRVLKHLAGISDASWWIQSKEVIDFDNPDWWARERKHPLS